MSDRSLSIHLKFLKDLVEVKDLNPLLRASYKDAIEALEKQIAFKPYDIWYSYAGEKVGNCKCGLNRDVLEHQNFWPHCGQRLGWD